MQRLLERVVEWTHSGAAHTLGWAALILLGGYILARLLGRWVRRWNLSAQGRMILERLVRYSVTTAAVILALRALGLPLGSLLGAAGLMTVAVGFAAKTSISNLISGLFLIGERPFAVGDVIEVDGTTGEVLSVDLMSTKLRTFDNRYVRIPNEMLLSKQVINVTHFPIRRFDFVVGVSYKARLDAVKRVLDRVAEQEPLCLTDPKPLFIFQKFGDSAIEIQYSVWAVRPQFLEMKNAFAQAVKRAFDEEGIEIPYPQRVIHQPAAEASPAGAPPAETPPDSVAI